MDRPEENNPVSHSALQSPVPLLDLKRENGPIRDEVLAALADVYDSGQFILGPACEALEHQVAQLCGTKFAIGCASGSDALLLALMAKDIGPGDEVIVPSFTFFATASAVWRLGAKPVFVDIDPITFCMDPERLAAAVTPRTRAVIPVHLFGQSADMDAVREIAAPNNIPIVEDCAQSVLATFNGQAVGSIGSVGTFSFYPTKNLGGCGDAGMLTTSDEATADRLRLLRAHGMRPRYRHQIVGINSRLDSMQSVILSIKLKHLPTWNAQRSGNAATYRQLFAERDLANWLVLPDTDSRCGHTWNQFTIRVPAGHRDALRAHLTDAKIGSEIYYPIPLHEQPCFEALGYKLGDLPETERAAREVLSLPVFPELTKQEQRTVVGSIADFAAATGLAKAG